MKKLTFGDLIPEFLIELKSLKTPKEIVEACARRNLEISDEKASKLHEQFRKAEQLSHENLQGVSGGVKGYSGTRKLFKTISARAAACGLDDDWDDDWEDDWDECWSDRPYCPIYSST